MERFCLSGFPEAELAAITEHLTVCEACHQIFVATLRNQRGSAPITFDLAPESVLRHEHVDFDQLVAVSDNKLDEADRKMVDIHLSTCATCQEDLRSFLAFRDQIEPELRMRYRPAAQDPRRREVPLWGRWRGLAWKPAYATAIVVIGIALLIGAAILLKRRADNIQVKQMPPSNVNLGAPRQTPSPDNRATNGPSPPVTPKETPGERPSNIASFVALNDGIGEVTVDQSGKVSGLDNVPAPTRDEIAQVLLSERVERPAILKDLAGQNGSLRGSSGGQSFKLTFPKGTVLVSNRPAFKWEKLLGASSYRVYVNDTAGQEVARSEDLSPERTEWALPKPLKRGEIYAWSVVALVNDQEIVSPGPGAPEMKFQVLPATSLRQLNELKKTRSHLALGLFYTKAGMLSNAEHEFKQLSLLNSKSKLATKLLRSIRLMRTQGQ